MDKNEFNITIGLVIFTVGIIYLLVSTGLVDYDELFTAAFQSSIIPVALLSIGIIYIYTNLPSNSSE